ncbi:hypothetical protein HYQ46_001982 [Verticillium longisporum]|nr:hypothetical protein HYQ46_001982 [Verticillium longisporum]
MQATPRNNLQCFLVHGVATGGRVGSALAFLLPAVHNIDDELDHANAVVAREANILSLEEDCNGPHGVGANLSVLAILDRVSTEGRDEELDRKHEAVEADPMSNIEDFLRQMSK